MRLNPARTPDQMQFTWQALKDGHFIYPDDDPSKDGDMQPDRWAALDHQLTDLKVLRRSIDPATAYTLQFISAGH